MTRPVPVCPRTIGPDYVPGNEDIAAWQLGQPRPASHYCQPRPCLGSACAAWVPEVAAGENVGVAAEWTTAFHDNACDAAREEPTGCGWCRDNIRCNPWPDPAAEKEK